MDFLLLKIFFNNSPYSPKLHLKRLELIEIQSEDMPSAASQTFHIIFFFPLSEIIPLHGIGWSDLEFFVRFLKCTHYCRSGIFLGVQFQKIGTFGHARVSQAQQSFPFQTITGTLIFLFFY